MRSSGTQVATSRSTPPLLRLPWQDRAGRLVPLKLATFLLLLLPAAFMLGQFATDRLGPRPLHEVIHEIGLWAFRLILLGLAITPLRQVWQQPQLILVRRMVGVAAALYAAAHLLAYTADLAFDWGRIASELASRFYLTIGLCCLLGLAVLAATSTDGAVRRLGGKTWQRLHRIVYALAGLALVHYFLQAKLDVTEPTLMAGMFLWLMAYRALAASRARGRSPGSAALLALGVAAGLLTMLGEAVYFHLRSGVDTALVLAANFSLATGWRPGLLVLLLGIAVAASALLPRLAARLRKSRPAPLRVGDACLTRAAPSRSL